jgi:predicted MFS family arabinose efflux permease
MLNANRQTYWFNMSDAGKPSAEKESMGKLLVPSLIVVFFAVTLSVPMLSLVTVDMAETFFGNAEPVALGLVAQINTVNRAAEVLFALLMGALTIRFKNRPLLLLGVVLLSVSAVGGFFAPNLPILQVFYALEGAGTVIVTISVYAIIGELVPLRQKPKVVSYINAVGFGAILIAAPAISIITNAGGWRLNFLWLILPTSIAGLILANMSLPRFRKEQSVTATSYLSGFKQVLKNKSAVSCLLSGMCGSVANISIWATAFYRQQFLSDLSVSDQINFNTGVIMVIAVVFIIVSVATGRLLNKISSVPLTVISNLGAGLLTLVFFSMSNLWVTVIIHVTSTAFLAMGLTSWSLLALDQVPDFRGTMMSLRSIFVSIGVAITTAVGGVAFALSGSYQVVGIALAIMIWPGAPLIYFLAKDPNKPSRIE